jgi:pyridoxal phosphate enzyme (YggS family)
MTARAAELASGLAQVRARVADACRSAGRSPHAVTLIVVTKTYPATDVLALQRLGVRDVGENRDQEAAPKREECLSAEPASEASEGALVEAPLRWHLIGQLQTNKCRSVAQWADVVHSLDRPRVVEALSRAAVERSRVLDALVQVSLDGDPARGGAHLDQLPELADRIVSMPGLTLRGLMAVAPLGMEPAAAFEVLAQASARLRAAHPEASWVSAGMSQDLEAAIAAGATHVRVGSAVLGARPALG